MPELTPVLSKEEIDKMVAVVAKKISSDYQGRELIIIGVLKGAFVFLSDLIRHLSIPLQIDFICISSYGSGTASSGNIRLSKEIGINIKDKDVLLVEDIIDSGATLNFITGYLKTFHPKSLRVCTLVDKYERREKACRIDYACHVIQNGFLVGYGLDYDENYRNLPEIYQLKL
jgi:hypoxanthine phosphoribosyltransferase